MPTFWARLSGYVKGLRLILYHLPMLLWFSLRSAPISKEASKRGTEQETGGTITIAKIRRRLLELKFLSEFILRPCFVVR